MISLVQYHFSSPKTFVFAKLIVCPVVMEYMYVYTPA